MNSNDALGKGSLHTPIGVIEIIGTHIEIVSVKFTDENGISIVSDAGSAVLNCIQQLKEYFAGERKKFDIVIKQPGTAFQQNVWNELQKIPFGKTKSYLELSKMLNNPKAIRAVGNANGKNNVAIIVPCHRIIGNNGTLVGYAGGLWRKRWLLEHEQRLNNGKLSLF